MSVLIPRRRFLQTLGLGAGAGMLGPFFRRAMAQQAPAPRVVFVVMGNGIQAHTLLSPLAAAAAADRVDPDRPEIIASPDLALAPSLGALAGGGGALDLIGRSVAVHGLSNKIAGGGHTTGFRCLSCSREQRQTMDDWIAERLHGDAPFRALRFGITGSTREHLQYGLSLRAPGRALPIIVSPSAAHTHLFGSVAAGAGQRTFETQAAVLEFTLQSIGRAQQSFVGNSVERAKLERYEATVIELREQQRRLSVAGDDLRALADLRAIDPEDPTPLESEHPLERLTSQFELATAALIGGLSNVVVLTNAVGNAFDSIRYTSLADVFGVPAHAVPRRHVVCHDPSQDNGQAVLDRVVGRTVEEIARMARALAATPEGGGTMLDRTLIVFMSDNGDTHHSRADNWPMLLVGGEGLGLRTGGRTVLHPRFGRDNNPRVANMMNTIAHLAGHPVDDFGNAPDEHLHPGPLADLLG